MSSAITRSLWDVQRKHAPVFRDVLVERGSRDFGSNIGVRSLPPGRYLFGAPSLKLHVVNVDPVVPVGGVALESDTSVLHMGLVDLYLCLSPGIVSVL